MKIIIYFSWSKLFLALLLLGIWVPNFARAQESILFRHTALITVTDEIPKSDLPQSLSRGGFELSNGTFQSFSDWYKPKAEAVYVEGLTEIYKNFGINWGVSTGQYGEKYDISPMMKLGFSYLAEVTPQSYLTFSVYDTFGGIFREKACVANYGEIGGVQQVNCRLAATELPPVETLKYLVRDDERDWGFSFSFNINF